MGFVIEGVREIAEELCQKAAARVQDAHPDLSVTWDVSTYGAASALVDASKVRPHRRGRCPRGQRGPRGALGSVSTQVAAHSHCPAVVIHDSQPTPAQDAPGGRRRRRLRAVDERDRLRLRRGRVARGRPDRGARLVAGLRRGRVGVGHLDRGLAEHGAGGERPGGRVPRRLAGEVPRRRPSPGTASTATRSRRWCARARTPASSSSGRAAAAASAGCCWVRSARASCTVPTAPWPSSAPRGRTAHQQGDGATEEHRLPVPPVREHD